jgi:hypothetical protein
MIGKDEAVSKAEACDKNDRSVGNKTFTAEDAEEDAEDAAELSH